jgi:hypothetical protein
MDENPMPADIAKLAKHISDLIDENTALRGRVEALERYNEGMREAGDELWYCLRHMGRVSASEVSDAVDDWKEARNNG